MRVKDRQKRPNVVFTKPFTTRLTRGKGEFSCRAQADTHLEIRDENDVYVVREVA